MHFPLQAIAFLTIMSEEHNSTSPTAVQMKNRQKTINTEDKLDVISRL